MSITLGGGGGDRRTAVGGRRGGGGGGNCPVTEILFDWTLFTFCIVLISLRPPVSNGCDFPAFLYPSDFDLETSRPVPGSTSPSSNWAEPTSNRKQTATTTTTTTTSDWLSFDGKLIWRGRIRGQNTGHEVVLTVRSGVLMMASSDRPQTTLFNRTCLNVFGSRKYFVSHEANDSKRQRFACIEFIERSTGVLQIRSSALVEEASPVGVCDDDKMDLDSWIFLLNAGPTSSAGRVGGGSGGFQGKKCILTGGFSVRIFDRTRHQGLCDGYRGETRIETDCLYGDGMYFYFRHQTCIPEALYMYSTQRTLCVASWTDGPYTFTLLRHDRHHYMWLLRFPTLTEDSFTAYLFRDLSTDSTEYVSRSHNFLRLDVVRDSPRPATSLCVDEFDVCSVWREPCTSGPQMALTCPRTCGICNASRPVVCSFAPELNGRWHDGVTGSGGSSVTFNRTSLVIVSGMGREEMRCIRWQFPTPSSSPSSGRLFTRFVADEMLVTEYVNGCRPRYACARILKKSSAVMFFKLSKTMTWPLTSSPADPIDCNNFDFEHVSSEEGGSGQDGVGGFRDRYFRLLFSTEKRGNPVQCRLPTDLNNYSVTLRNGTECTGSLTEADAGNEFDVTLSGCLENETNFSYACLESSRLLPSGDLLIVTSSTSSSSASSSSSYSSFSSSTSSSTSSSPSSRTSSNFSIHCWVFPKSPQFVFYQIDGAQCNEASRGRLRQEVIVPVAVFSRSHRRKPPPPATSRKGEGVMDDGRLDHVTVSRQLDSPAEVPAILNNNQVLLDDDHRSGSDVKAKMTPSGDLTRSTNNHDVNPNPFILLCVVLTLVLFQCIYFCHQA